MSEQLTVRAAIDRLIEAAGARPIENTVDTIKSGDPDAGLTGIVTTFLATVEVVRRAAELGANLIVAHEPVYYNHRDDADWLEGDPVYDAKRRLLEDERITVFRFHDYAHARQPDAILSGVLSTLGWEDRADPDVPYVVELPPTRLSDLVITLKERLGVESVRVAGSPDALCRRIALLVGAADGRYHVLALSRHGADVVVAGEAREWEALEYVRDANALGMNKALVVVGHERSEEPGMEWVAGWLRTLLPGVRIEHVPAGEPFRTL